MNRQVPKNVRKTAGVLMLTGVMAIGAFSLLKTGVLSTHSNEIATVAGTTEGGGTGGEGVLPDGGEDNKPGDNTGTNKFGLKIHNDATVINLSDALPMTKEKALDSEANKHTFTITNTGSVEQVVRLSMGGIVKGTAGAGQLPADKINIVVREVGQVKEITAENTTLATIKEAGVKGYGECFKLAGKGTKQFELFAWVDDKASMEDLYGTAGTESRSIKFNTGASAVQADIFTNTSEGSAMNTEFENLVAKQ